jgi:hypothetical protein
MLHFTTPNPTVNKVYINGPARPGDGGDLADSTQIFKPRKQPLRSILHPLSSSPYGNALDKRRLVLNSKRLSSALLSPLSPLLRIPRHRPRHNRAP